MSFFAFGLTQFPLLVQTFLLHPSYRSNQNARLLRLALIPIALSFLTSFALQVHANFTSASDNLTKLFIGSVIMTSAFRSLIWGFTTEPYHRLSSPNPTGSSFIDRLSFSISLMTSPRGVGWSFGVPAKPYDQTKSAFLYDTLQRLFTNIVIFASSVICLGILDTSIYSRTLLFRHLAALFSGTFSWTMIDIGGCLSRLISLCLGLSLAESTYFLDLPFKATNLCDFWSRRWHSLLKQVFVEAGGKPGEWVIKSLMGTGFLSRTSFVLSSFLLSGLMHELPLWFATRPDFSFRTTIFFVAQGLGVVMESSFYKLTGNRVGGWIGRIWMFSWLVGWGRLMIDAFMDQGLVDKELVDSYFANHRYL